MDAALELHESREQQLAASPSDPRKTAIKSLQEFQKDSQPLEYYRASQLDSGLGYQLELYRYHLKKISHLLYGHQNQPSLTSRWLIPKLLASGQLRHLEGRGPLEWKTKVSLHFGASHLWSKLSLGDDHLPLGELNMVYNPVDPIELQLKWPNRSDSSMVARIDPNSLILLPGKPQRTFEHRIIPVGEESLFLPHGIGEAPRPAVTVSLGCQAPAQRGRAFSFSDDGKSIPTGRATA